ncbi:LANO_0E02234g1_1 [Lachancea nothofagi CBS 11611]|uniref:LANO_0E02234g1_1 n=1 Tax=Lachancea nothofagi CBS 11611 TaxID=1266666 RepID=A0A1G4JPW8_9SACH|nr:LANO_0E02234g1_1 [Lachancea nothofagi CBS 11611]
MGNDNLTRAMLVALFERAYDRQFVIELENSLISFIDSGLNSYQLESMNSYYRLLAHQVAEYHGLKHALAKNNDTCVVVFKGEETFVRDSGKILLQNLDPPHGSLENWSSYPTELFKTKSPHSVAHKNSSLQPQDQSWESQNTTPNDNLPTTPQKPIAMDDDSPQPHQFETSRYKFSQQSQKPRKRKFIRRSVSYAAPPFYYQPPPLAPPTYPMSYMIYNPYPMMYIPQDHRFPQYQPDLHSMGMNQFNYGPISEVQAFQSSASGSSVFSSKRPEPEHNQSFESASLSERQDSSEAQTDIESSMNKISSNLERLEI